MFKKHIIFQILYIIVGPLRSASLKRFVFYKVPPSDKHSLLWLASWHSALWLAKHHKPSRRCYAPFHNRQPQLSKLKTINNVLSFTISSSLRGEQSRVTDTVTKLVCVCKQAIIKTISDGVYTPLWCDPVSLSHTHTQAVIKTISDGVYTPLWCDPVSLFLTHTQAVIKAISDGLYTPLWCDPVSLSHTHTQAVIKTISDGLYTPLWCDPVSLFLTHTQAVIKTISDGLYTPLWCDPVALSLTHTHTSHD